ncbi:phage adaptor protein [Sphingobium sp. HDIP04]|uniref:phage adaptor protein n=1 Tax=Sphingobium sp. HDIP04 TaxID=428994 RepID=UPI00126912A4|nr:hypothetical protein [Sphingobium sp. HDIP04]
MAILSAMQSAALRLVGRKPTTFFGASGTFEAEIADWTNEVAQDIAKYQDWQALQSVATITGDGSTEEFDLPADYDRMLVYSDVQDLEAWCWGYRAFDDINQFLYHQARGFGPWPGGWIIYGNKLRFSPAPADGQIATYPYIIKNWAKSSDSTPKAAFDIDTDSFVLPERLLTLALVWRWRENKKLDASGDQEAFIKALDEYGAKDRGSRPIFKNARRYIAGAYPAWPWALGGV